MLKGWGNFWPTWIRPLSFSDWWAADPKESLLFSNWGVSWWLVKQRIEEYLERNDIYQGKKFDYLNGKALR
jgi:hypothetical protein